MWGDSASLSESDHLTRLTNKNWLSRLVNDSLTIFVLNKFAEALGKHTKQNNEIIKQLEQNKKI